MSTVLEQSYDFTVNVNNLIMNLSAELGSQFLPSIDIVWISLTTYLVFSMQLGFGFLQLGFVRAKNQQNMLLKNVLNTLCGTLWWWWIGYGFAFGHGGNGYIGGWYFCALDFNKSLPHFSKWLFHWAFASVTLTIVSGAVAERIKLETYAILSMFMAVWVYPLIVAWCWRPTGWLAIRGYHDFAGSGVVHMVGGYAALAATLVLKPRIGRFVKNVDQSEFEPADKGLLSFGTLILWFGFFGFNCGSSFSTHGGSPNFVSIIGRAGMNTTLSACTGGLTSFFIHALGHWKQPNRYNLPDLTNGVLGGLVAISAGCNVMEPEGAFVTGIMAGIIYQTISAIVQLFKVDDPLDAFAVHGGCGYLGIVITGVLHRTHGIFYGFGAKLFGTQIYAGCCIAIWSFLMVGLFCLVAKLLGALRVSPDVERIGLDNAEYCKCDKTQKGQVVDTYYQNVQYSDNHQVQHHQQVITHTQQHTQQQPEKYNAELEMKMKIQQDNEYMYNTEQLQFQ